MRGDEDLLGGDMANIGKTDGKDDTREQSQSIMSYYGIFNSRGNCSREVIF